MRTRAAWIRSWAGWDGDLRLLEVWDERQLGHLDSGVRGPEVGFRLVVGRDQVPAVEDVPAEHEAERPGGVQLELAAAVGARAADIGQEVSRRPLDPRLSGGALQPSLPVLRALSERFGAQGRAIDRGRLVFEIVFDLRLRAR